MLRQVAAEVEELHDRLHVYIATETGQKWLPFRQETGGPYRESTAARGDSLQIAHVRDTRLAISIMVSGI